MVAPSASAATSRTSPTITPRTFTSEASCSWLPAVSVSSVTIATSVNAFLYMATDSPSSIARTTRNASPWMRRLTVKRLPRALMSVHPAIRTVVVEPQMARDRNRSMMLTATIENRTARPTARPTPAGPPLAR